MIVGIPKEVFLGERRVALVPNSVALLVKSGFDVIVQSKAGNESMISDDEYVDAGASISKDARFLYSSADTILKVQKPLDAEVELFQENTTLICFIQPVANSALLQQLSDHKVSVFSMDAIPRIAKAQSMDALSSMASISGYKAALMAAESMSKYLPMMITAAGTTPPAKGLVIGAGVAGLQSIATAKRLGAVMYAFDVRPDVEEQVKSLGANFISTSISAEDAESSGGYAKEIDDGEQHKDREILQNYIKDMDFVISTAAVPGKPAPLLITSDMVNGMRPGSVIIDLAAETGGNCELTRPGETHKHNGVMVSGPLNVPSSMPLHASQLYSRNVYNLLMHIMKEDDLKVDSEDEIILNSRIAYKGTVLSK